MSTPAFYHGTGRRKTAVARVRLLPGEGEIVVNGRTATVRGGATLQSAAVMCSDLRASAALVLAALIADGESVLDRVYHMDRGYERLEEKLRGIGAQIRRMGDVFAKK